MGKWRFEMANLHKTKFNRGYLFAVNAFDTKPNVLSTAETSVHFELR